MLTDPAERVDLSMVCTRGDRAAAGEALHQQVAGFAWQDDDPGGLQSQTWYDQARAGDPAAEARLLVYNRDDVRAMQHLRAWLTADATTVGDV
ncbi:RNase_H superfamily protein [Geodermatophilus amargosae]|uniref:RNase_H superfamily protein n=1 Tax=Geodermatophilus amargosae TaxID=1296565 RepID=A0A1I6YY92_9ACTN|nr:ribonuclease H-like domain-containing protein [Geodermatophilus amargosae]SFT55394.1 RNase_H superfamily protein [Geodermatophilus amargosae]